MVGPENTDYGMPTCVTVMGRGTSVFRSLEDHSLIETVERYRIDPGCEPRYRQRPRMSVRTSGNTQQNFHPPIGTYGTYTNPSQGLPYGDPIGEGMRPKSHRFDRANISTHVLMDPPHTCFWASNDVPLAKVGGQPRPRKLKDAT